MNNKNEIILFETEDRMISLPVMVKEETVWLNRNQLSELFERDIKTIGKHINNALKEELSGQNAVVAKFATTASDGKKYMVEHYNLDVIISVGYRVKSKRGIEFRRWANGVLKEYIIRGYAVNHNRMDQLNEVIRVMKRVENSLDTKQVLTVVEKYSQALELLDAYDHQNMVLLTTGFVQNYSGFFVRNQTGFLSARDFYLNFWRTFFYNSLRCTNA